jgi:hypothetical protein
MAETSFLVTGVLHCFDDTTVLPRADEGAVGGLPIDCIEAADIFE